MTPPQMFCGINVCVENEVASFSWIGFSEGGLQKFCLGGPMTLNESVSLRRVGFIIPRSDCCYETAGCYELRSMKTGQYVAVN